MRVLSVFDGISCGMMAFRKAGVPVDEYHAFEIDRYAVECSQHNYPEIIRHGDGDVFKADFTQFEGVDFLVGGSPCFSAGTMVYTDKGYKPIENIKVGDMVLTHKNRFRMVTATGSKLAAAHELRATGLLTTTVTSNHPYYTRKAKKVVNPSTGGYIKSLEEPEWVQVKDMSHGITHIGMNILQIEENPLDLDEETCWLLGRYVADGHIRKDKRKGRKNSYQYQFILSIGKNKLDEFKAHIHSRHYSCYPHTTSTYRCVFSNMDLVNFVIEHDFGRSCYTKRIPPVIMNLPIPLLRAFLEGYLSGDGCIRGNTVSMCTTSRELAMGLQMAIMKAYRRNVSVSEAHPRTIGTIEGRVVSMNRQWALSYHPENKAATQGRVVDNQMWTPVKEVFDAVNVMVVYNMSVDEDESYTANNAIVHNCTYWSGAQTKNRETEAHGMGWELFQQYVRALREAKPRYFIYENNKSMADAIKKEISETFGFEPVMINSALVSAQNRERYYWVGKRMDDGSYAKVKVEQPEDMHISLTDMLDSGYADREKGHAVIASAGRTTYREYLVKNQGNVAFEPVDAPSTSGLKQDEAYTVKDGLITIRGKEYPIKLDDGRYRIRKLSVGECKKLQTIPDNFDMKVISNTQAYKCIGNGWTVNVIVHLIQSALRGDTDAIQTRFD